MLGANLAQEEDEDLKIHVFNSRSASIGETLIVKKIVECEEAGMSFERVVETVELYISTQHTYFVLENLETLRKNGRLSKTKALVASALKIKPVMGATSEGDIVQLDQARGINKALMKMVDAIVNDAQHVENKTLAISHCNCPERADAQGKCWPGIKTIASDMKLSRSTVKRALHDLEQHGYLKKASRHRPNGSSTSNLYTVK